MGASTSFQVFAYLLLLGVAGIFLYSGIYSQHRLVDKSLLTPDPRPKVAVANYDKPPKITRTPYTLDNFRVHGVNLAHYGFETDHGVPHTIMLTEYMELYNDFCLKPSRLQGDEDWSTMLEYRQGLESAGLVFYYDKIAQKRWLQAFGDIPTPKPLQLVYRNHDMHHASTQNNAKAATWIQEHLPHNQDFVAKLSHTPPDTAGDGVWFVHKLDDTAKKNKKDKNGKEKHHGGKKDASKSSSKPELQKDLHDDAATVAHHLAMRLQRTSQKNAKNKAHKSNWARHHVEPGYIIEERIVSIGNYGADDSTDSPATQHPFPDGMPPPMEFKVYILWGRVYVASWNLGTGDQSVSGMVYRNGTVVPSHSHKRDPNQEYVTADDDEFPLADPRRGNGKKRAQKQDETKKKGSTKKHHYASPGYDQLPEWVNWARVLELAEGLGQHKDMIRVDLLVGLPANHPSWKQGRAEQIAATEVYFNGLTLDPLGDELPDAMLQEAARLWVAGYKMGFFARIPNLHEVPTDSFINNDLFLTERKAIQHALGPMARHPVWGTASVQRKRRR